MPRLCLVLLTVAGSCVNGLTPEPLTSDEDGHHAQEQPLRPVEGRPPGLLTTWMIASDLDVAVACRLAAGQLHGSQVLVIVPGLYGW
jgi:hypothetical protein